MADIIFTHKVFSSFTESTAAVAKQMPTLMHAEKLLLYVPCSIVEMSSNLHQKCNVKIKFVPGGLISISVGLHELKILQHDMDAVLLLQILHQGFKNIRGFGINCATQNNGFYLRQKRWHWFIGEFFHSIGSKVNVWMLEISFLSFKLRSLWHIQYHISNFSSVN